MGVGASNPEHMDRSGIIMGSAVRFFDGQSASHYLNRDWAKENPDLGRRSQSGDQKKNDPIT